MTVPSAPLWPPRWAQRRTQSAELWHWEGTSARGKNRQRGERERKKERKRVRETTEETRILNQWKQPPKNDPQHYSTICLIRRGGALPQENDEEWNTHRHGQISTALRQSKAILFASPALQRERQEGGGTQIRHNAKQTGQWNVCYCTQDRFT